MKKKNQFEYEIINQIRNIKTNPSNKLKIYISGWKESSHKMPC